MESAPPLASAAPDECPTCLKPASLCLCAESVTLEHRLQVVILQHPQEQDRLLGTARLAAGLLRHAQVKVGLSWPSLSRLLGRPAEPQRWAVLYLGSAKAANALPDAELVLLDRKGQTAARQDFGGLHGIIVLDGTWSQSKALWWRNPWMLKCRRVVLNPARPSLYGRLRREPRRDGLSTIEAVAMLLSRIEGRPDIETALTKSFETMLSRYRAAYPTERRAKRRRSPPAINA